MPVHLPEITVFIAPLKPFSQIHKVRIASSWQQLTDTCTIVLPLNIKIRDGDKVLAGLNDIVFRGDGVTIRAGYKPNHSTVVFRGFVRQIRKNIPLEIICEDYAYLLKLDTYSVSWKSATLRTIVNHILTGDNIKKQFDNGFNFTLDVLETEPFPFAIPKENGAQALQRLQQMLGIVSYFRYDAKEQLPPVLVVGFKYPGKRDRVKANKPVLRTGVNVVNWNLTYQNKQDVLIQVQAIINKKNGTKKVIKLGTEGGSVRTLNYPDMPEDLVRQSAEEKLNGFTRDGFDGTVTTFGAPVINHGDVVVLDDPIYTREKNAYFVDGTVWEFSHKPSITRELNIGERAI